LQSYVDNCALPRGLLLPLLAVVAAVFLWSALGARDRFTWFLEVLPRLVGLPLFALT